MGAVSPGSNYASWANCGLQSTVTTEDVKYMAPGIRMISTTSLTLSAIDSGKATVDMVVRNRIEGGPFSMPPTEILQEIEIPAAPPPAETEYWSHSESHEDGSWGLAEVLTTGEDAPVAEGEDALVIDGQTIPCRWTLREIRTGDVVITLKTWTSDRIPGGIARFESRVEGIPDQDSTTTVVSFLKK